VGEAAQHYPLDPAIVLNLAKITQHAPSNVQQPAALRYTLARKDLFDGVSRIGGEFNGHLVRFGVVIARPENKNREGAKGKKGEGLP